MWEVGLHTIYLGLHCTVLRKNKDKQKPPHEVNNFPRVRIDKISTRGLE